jgi:MFS family permease
MAFFSAGSLVVGLSRNATSFIVGRTTQGVGGGGIEALSEIILTDITTLRERPKYLGLLGLVWAAGSILGPFLGGVFAEYSSWRWIAWINLPLMGIAILLVPFFLALATDGSGLRAKIKRVDWIGLVLLLVSLTALIVPVTWAGQLYPWQNFRTILPLALGLVLLFVFVLHQRHRVEPVFRPGLFVFRTSTMAYIGAFIHGIVLWCVVFYLPLYFESAVEQYPLQAAISGLPLILTVSPMAIIGALIIEWTRHYSWLNRSAWIILTIGLGTMMLLDEGTSKATYSAVQIPAGLGAGTLFVGLALALQASISADDVGVATGIFVFFRNLGSVFGVAIGSSIFSNEFDKHIQGIRFPPSLPALNSGNAVENIPMLKTLDIPAGLRLKILEAYAASFRIVWLVMACLSGIGLASMLLMRELTIEREGIGNQALTVPVGAETNPVNGT